MQNKKTNLFIYGSLRDAKIFQSVCGLGFTRKGSKVDEQTLLAQPAFLPGHRRVSPDNVYFYAVPSPSAKIEGLVIYDVPQSAIVEIDKYEGKRYDRERVTVNTAKGRVSAQAYLVSHESMRKHFGDRFHVNLIHELWLRKRIEKFIEKRTRPGEKSIDADVERLAVRELLATTERDLVISHYRADAVSDYYLEHEMDRPLPSIKQLRDDSEAAKYVRNYLALVVKQVLLNQLDERIQARYRFQLERMLPSERYFKRSISILIALQMINSNSPTVELIVEKAMEEMPFEKHDLIDYVKYAVRAAISFFDSRVVQAHLERIRSNLQPGLIPLGCELELSNLGAAAVRPQTGDHTRIDPAYAGFRFFHDFYLDVLTWKLGGYIDDHTGSDDRSRRVGFLELAPARLNIAGELSRPATCDPWLLNQLIQEIAVFYDVQPHSLHLSFQLLKRQVDNQEVLPVGFVKCLLALGGGTERREDGRLWVSRLGYDEITRREFGDELVFARTDTRRWYMGADEVADKVPTQSATYVQQYKFIRLERQANYEPLIMCLKGLQMGYNPADYLTAEQLAASAKLRRDYEELKAWALEPTPISPRIVKKFLAIVREGLMNERHRQPAHELHYIDWALAAIDVQIRMFNEQVKEPSRRSTG
jgi:gamma-glutamylcyclotransferase (GGCT)/AIG2-like uncharacterized protein YtfP